MKNSKKMSVLRKMKIGRYTVKIFKLKIERCRKVDRLALERMP